MSEAHPAAQLASAHHVALYRFALTLARHERHEAEEIVQQVYVEVLEGRAKLTEAREPRAFLFGVARKVAAGRRRRRGVLGRLVELLGGAQQGAPRARDPESAAVTDQEAARVRHALRALPSRQAEVLSLVFGEGLTVEEAAEVLAISIGAARQHYHRAKQAMARRLEVSDGPGALEAQGAHPTSA